MAHDYSKTEVLRFLAPTDSATIANGTQAFARSVMTSSKNFQVIGIRVQITVAATAATQSVVIQKASAVSFSSPTTLATATITSANAAGTLIEVFCDADDSFISAGEFVRIAHVATGADATLNYLVDLITTPRHY